MIEFKHADEFEKGIIYKLLCESYAALLKVMPEYVAEFKNSWKKSDYEIFNFPDSIGKCVLISVLNKEPIGFVSWDPRRVPETGEIGQNCIIPLHRGKGYGKLQVKKVLKIFLTESTRIIKVTTDSHPFFIPAQKTYLSCGFKEAGRSFEKKYGGVELIHYEYNHV